MQYTKVVFIGDGGVGKTSIINRIRQNGFVKMYTPTLESEINEILSSINFTIYDTPGQMKYKIKKEYYCDADICVLVLDNTSILTYLIFC